MQQDIKEPYTEEPLDKCPNCGSIDICSDSPGLWRFLFSLCLFPFSLLVLLWNPNRYCQQCGTRFKTIEKLD